MPFNEDGTIDELSLLRQLDFCVEAGSHAIAFGMGSESALLTDAERVQVWSLAARHLDGQLPLIAATAHASREGTVALTQLALESGADCAMVNPAPYSGNQLVGLFRDLSRLVQLPLMLQDASGDAPAAVLLQAVDAAPRICCLKLEAPAAPEKIGAVVSALRQDGLSGGKQARVITVLGGGNGNLLPEELGRGSVGTMPHPVLIDAFRAVCDHYAADNATSGQEVYQRKVAPVLRAVLVGGSGSTMLWLQKTLFHHAGILRTVYCRRRVPRLPSWLMEQIRRHLDSADLAISRLLQANSA